MTTDKRDETCFNPTASMELKMLRKLPMAVAELRISKWIDNAIASATAITALRAEVERLKAEHWVYQVGAEEWAHREDCPCSGTGVLPTVNLRHARIGANVERLADEKEEFAIGYRHEQRDWYVQGFGGAVIVGNTLDAALDAAVAQIDGEK